MTADWTGGPDKQLAADEERRGAAKRFRDADVPLIKLWAYYYGIGGNVDELSLDAYLHEALRLPPAQVGLIDTAMKELAGGEGE